MLRSFSKSHYFGFRGPENEYFRWELKIENPLDYNVCLRFLTNSNPTHTVKEIKDATVGMYDPDESNQRLRVTMRLIFYSRSIRREDVVIARLKVGHARSPCWWRSDTLLHYMQQTI